MAWPVIMSHLAGRGCRQTYRETEEDRHRVMIRVGEIIIDLALA